MSDQGKKRMTQQINRRTVTKGIAWSVPAVAVAGAAPAFAASIIVTTRAGYAVKLPGNSCNSTNGSVKGYGMNVEICTNQTGEVQIDLGSAQVYTAGSDTPENGSGWAGPTPWNTTPEGVITIPAGVRCVTVLVGIDRQGNSMNQAIKGTISYTATAVGEDPVQGTIKFYSPTTPPAEACEAPPIGAPPAAVAPVTAVQEQPSAAAEAPVEEPVVEAPGEDKAPVVEETPAEGEAATATAEATSGEAGTAEMTVVDPVEETE